MIKHLALEEFWRLQEVRRVAAAESRRTGLSAGAEPVRHVLDAAHLHLASHLAHEGFHYSRTGKYLYRRSDGISHRIAFTTSDANIPDKFIALYIHFHVRCPKFAGWRAEHGGVHTDLISHRWLADFEPGVIAVEHELGPRSTRDEELHDALVRLREHGLVYFRHLFDKMAVLASAEAWPSPGFATYEISSAVEFALFQGRADIAEALAERFFTRNPHLIPAYKDFVSRRRIHPSADGPDVFAWDLAKIVGRHGLAHPPSAA